MIKSKLILQGLYVPAPLIYFASVSNLMKCFSPTVALTRDGKFKGGLGAKSPQEKINFISD
jgi:hypothetical protein